MQMTDEILRDALRRATGLGQPHPRVRESVLRAMGCRASGWGGVRRLNWAGAIAICLVLAVALTAFLTNGDIAYAMERRVLNLESYHGILEVTAASLGNGASAEPVVEEIWWQDGRFVVKRADSQLYGDGAQLWEVTPFRKSATLHWDLGELSGQPCNLRWIVDTVSHSQHRSSGKETILGREATRVDGTSAGGWPYSVWIDPATDLPLQFVQTYPGGLQQQWRFTTLEINPTVEQSLFAYEPPEGWRVDRQTLGRRVGTVAEAQKYVGFPILDPGIAPDIIVVEDRPVAPGTTSACVQMDCGGTVITEAPASGPIEAPLTDGVTLGEAADSLVIFDGDQIEWRQGDVQISVRGARSLEVAKKLLPSLKLPDTRLDLAARSKFRVAIDPDQARLTQQMADGGQATPQLFLEQVTRDFAKSSAKLTLEASTGGQAIVGLSDGPYLRVYLARPIRQNPTGIWVVAGYDPR